MARLTSLSGAARKRPMPPRAYCPLPTSVPCIIVVVPAFGRGPRTKGLETRNSAHGSRSTDHNPRNSVHGPRSTVLETRSSDHGSCNSTLNLAADLRYNITIILGARMQFRKGNKIGAETRFGPDWPGERCGARTKAGTPCKRPAVKRTGRCTRHGGKSTGPRTEEGRARIAAAKTSHGRMTKDARAEAKRRAQVGREIRAELREIERGAIAEGRLARRWRDLL